AFKSNRSAGGGGGNSISATPPPPAPPSANITPAEQSGLSVNKPAPSAPADPRQIKVSGGVLQGSATRKVQPAYPTIAKAARTSGAVQVQVTISESGEVINAQVISGHPLMRDAALQAAKQWRFKPTELSGMPVKTQGVITFNFDSSKGWAPGETVSLTPMTEE